MKHITMSLKSKSRSGLLVLLLVITTFLLIGCNRYNYHRWEWNQNANRIEWVGPAKGLKSEEPVNPKEATVADVKPAVTDGKKSWYNWAAEPAMDADSNYKKINDVKK